MAQFGVNPVSPEASKSWFLRKICTSSTGSKSTSHNHCAEVLAEFERSLILSRTDEGRTREMARGLRFGRKPKLTPHQIAEAKARRDAGEAMTDIGRSYNVSLSTISRL